MRWWGQFALLNSIYVPYAYQAPTVLPTAIHLPQRWEAEGILSFVKQSPPLNKNLPFCFRKKQIRCRGKIQTQLYDIFVYRSADKLNFRCQARKEQEQKEKILPLLALFRYAFASLSLDIGFVVPIIQISRHSHLCQAADVCGKYRKAWKFPSRQEARDMPQARIRGNR